MESWLEPCLDAEQMRAVDRWAIDQRGVPSLELMETAGGAVAEAAAEVASTGGSAAIVCGKGNNGGDGLVAARKLAESEGAKSDSDYLTAKPYLDGLDYLVLGSGSDGDRSVVDVLLGIR